MAFDAQGFQKVSDLPAPAAPEVGRVDEVGMLILKARAKISHPLYWCQGRYEYGNRFCILGAFGQRTDGNDTECPRVVKDRIASALPPHTPYKVANPDRAIMRFNDRKSTTHADVLALLSRAASAEGK